MKAKKIFFNGEQFEICDNLQAMIENSLDPCVKGRAVVKGVYLGDDYVQIKIYRLPKRHYMVDEGFISLGDAMILSGALNENSEAWISLDAHFPCRNLMKHHLSISEIVDGYNKIMKRNNKLLDMEVMEYPDEVSFTLIFKK